MGQWPLDFFRGAGRLPDPECLTPDVCFFFGGGETTGLLGKTGGGGVRRGGATRFGPQERNQKQAA